MAYGQSPTASPELTPNLPQTWAQVDEIVGMEFALDNLAQHGGADLATTIELASLTYGTAKSGITLTRIGTKYFLRSGNDLITELGPTTIRQLDNDHTPFAPLGRGSTVNNIDRFHPRTFREQLAIEEVMQNPSLGQRASSSKLGDSRWPGDEGWQKLQQVVDAGGREGKIVVHYNYNPLTNQVDDFKIVYQRPRAPEPEPTVPRGNSTPSTE